MLEWTGKTRESILLEPLSTSANAEEVLRRHMEVRDQMQAKDYEFAYVDELGRRLMAKSTEPGAIQDKLAELVQARGQLDNEWTKRDQECRQLVNYFYLKLFLF